MSETMGESYSLWGRVRAPLLIGVLAVISGGCASLYYEIELFPLDPEDPGKIISGQGGW